MFFEQCLNSHVSNSQITCKSQWDTCEYGTCKCQVKIEVYRIYFNTQKLTVALIAGYEYHDL